MKLNVRRFQEGGPVGPAPEEQGAPMPPESAPEAAPQDGMEQQLMQVAQQIAQQIGDPQAIEMLGQMLIQIAQSAQGGAQVPPESQQPVYQRNGGTFKRIR